MEFKLNNVCSLDSPLVECSKAYYYYYYYYKRIRLNSMGTTPTPTRMRLSCNFVNVYTIAYRVQYTFTRVHARIPNGQPCEDPREEKRDGRARVGRVGGQVGEDCRACPARAQIERGSRLTRVGRVRARCHENATRKLFPWNLSHTALPLISVYLVKLC